MKAGGAFGGTNNTSTQSYTTPVSGYKSKSKLINRKPSTTQVNQSAKSKLQAYIGRNHQGIGASKP